MNFTTIGSIFDAWIQGKIHDQSATRLRELDLKIQALGWSTELI